jgi:hypothetical protein
MDNPVPVFHVNGVYGFNLSLELRIVGMGLLAQIPD